jgi:hypothetical protein
MPRETPPKFWTANRRGCFAIAAALAVLILVLVYIGLRAAPESGLNSVMHFPGALVGSG